jgi:hypothetical protein
MHIVLFMSKTPNEEKQTINKNKIIRAPSIFEEKDLDA